MNRRVRWAEAGGYLIALAGVLALIAIAAAPGTPFVIAVVVMILGLAPVMLGFYELGGRTTLVLARGALTIGIVAVIVAAVTLLAGTAGIVTIDESRAATGALAILAVSMIAYGAWMVGATVLAGPWLTGLPRWFGAVCGLGWLLAGVGFLLGGAEHPVTYTGAIGYQLLYPIWGLVIGRRFAAVLAARGA
jgi:hypothetical protein